MQKVVGIVFNKNGRIYNFDPINYDLKVNDEVIVETEKGLQYGFVTTNIKEIEDFDIKLKPIIRFANKEDKYRYEKNINDSLKALEKAKNIAEDLELNMRLIDANFTLDRNQLLFNFTADERIDFRELAKRLASIYKTRIELRQIGIRDKAKEIGGLGPCGRILCCKSFLNDLNAVTINMAKNQMLALNPSKINGVCGRLLCCLNYEDDVYKKLRKKIPDIGTYYKNGDISGKVVNMDILKGKIEIENESGEIIEVIIENGSN